MEISLRVLRGVRLSFGPSNTCQIVRQTTVEASLMATSLQRPLLHNDHFFRSKRTVHAFTLISTSLQRSVRVAQENNQNSPFNSSGTSVNPAISNYTGGNKKKSSKQPLVTERDKIPREMIWNSKKWGIRNNPVRIA